MRDTTDELWLQILIAELFNKPFLRAYLHILITTGYIWTFSISNDCATIGHIPYVVWSWKRDPTGELRLQIRMGNSLIQTCVRILQALKYITISYR